MLLRSSFFVPVRSFAFNRLNHNVARSVLKAGELDHCNVIATGFKLQAAESVCQIFGQTVFEDAVFEHRLVNIALYLAEKLVLAARHAEDNLGVPRHGVYKSIVSCGVTGMESNHHIGIIAGIVCNVTHEEFKFIVTQTQGNFIAEIYNVGLKVKSDDFNISSF